MEEKNISETFEELRKIIGSHWDNVICICRELLKDEPCKYNCKEFHNEQLTNHKKEQKQ